MRSVPIFMPAPSWIESPNWDPRLIAVVIRESENSTLTRFSSQLSQQPDLLVVSCSNSLPNVITCCRRVAPCILVNGVQWGEDLDFEELNKIAHLHRGIRILAVGPDIAEEQVRGLIMAGCKGYFSLRSPEAAFPSAIRALAAGELWASRLVLSRIVQNMLVTDNTQRLSPRESEILRLIGLGFKNREIAERLFISTETVRWHVRGIYPKIGASDRQSAVAYAVEHSMRGERIRYDLSQRVRTMPAPL